MADTVKVTVPGVSVNNTSRNAVHVRGPPVTVAMKPRMVTLGAADNVSDTVTVTRIRSLYADLAVDGEAELFVDIRTSENDGLLRSANTHSRYS